MPVKQYIHKICRIIFHDFSMTPWEQFLSRKDEHNETSKDKNALTIFLIIHILARNTI